MRVMVTVISLRKVPLIPMKSLSQISYSYTLPEAKINPQVIQAWIRMLSEMVAVRLRQQNLVSATVHLWLNGPVIGNFGAQETHQMPTMTVMKSLKEFLK